MCCEQRPLIHLAEQYGTPLYVYSATGILDRLAMFHRAFAHIRHTICSSIKANPNLGILKLVAQNGAGFDVVSGGELERVLRVDRTLARHVVFSGVGKTRAEMELALQNSILLFNVESAAELKVLMETATRTQYVAPLAIRVNPDVSAKTHPYISTGLKDNKFGVAHEDALRVYQHAASLKGLKVIGIDCHIGSQITDATPYLDAMDRILDLVVSIEAAGIPLEHIDFGGGLGINYNHDTPPAADALWQQLLTKLDARGFGAKKLMIEPGRSLVGNAGVCLTEVLYLKFGEQKNFCIIDAAMNDLPRPALYQAFHAIVPVAWPGIGATGATEATYDVVGPVCESGDWIGHERALSVAAGDHLAVLSAGAYCMSMASNYNTRNRAAEILVDGGKSHLIRRRETVQEQMQQERLVDS